MASRREANGEEKRYEQIDSGLYVERYMLVAPQRVLTPDVAVGTGDVAALERGALSRTELDRDIEKLQVFSGKRAVARVGVEVEGSGAFAEGHIKVRGFFHLHTTLYDVYQMPSSDRINVWIFNYSRDSSRSELREAVNNSTAGAIDIDLKFRLQGNDFGITAVYITQEAIRTQIAGSTKDFVTSNPENAGAVSPDGSPYPGGFEPLP